MRRALISLVGVLVLTSCTPAQIRAWVRWHEQDPAAAEAFARQPEIVEQLAAAASSDGPQFAQWLDGTPGDCDSYVPLFEAHGLPASTFKRIAWRESGCDHRSFVIDRDDAGGGLLGINLKGRLAATWHDWCGATLDNITDAAVNVRCAAEAYERLGMRPWR